MHTETHGSPRKLTEAHGSSRISKKTTFLLVLPLGNSFFRVNNRRQFGIVDLSVRARGLSHIGTTQICRNKRYVKKNLVTKGIIFYTYMYIQKYDKKSSKRVFPSSAEAHGCPRKHTGLHGSSRVSKKNSFFLFLPLENAILRVKNRR